MRRSGGALAVAVGTMLLVLSFSVQPAHGQAPDQAGWWFEAKTKALPVAPPAPPTVPDGGLYVQHGPDGPMAFGAVRARVRDAASATLTLTAAEGSTTTLGAPLQACATTGSWDAPLPAPGYWEDAPSYGTVCAPGTVSTDGKYVAFLLGSPFVASGTVDVAVVPVDGATPFAIAFDAPNAESLTVKQGAPTTPPPPAATSPTTAFTPPRTEPRNATASPPFTVAPTSAPSPSATTATRSPVAQAVLELAGFGDPDRGERMGALGGSSMIVIGWWLLSSRRVRLPRLVGAPDGTGAGVADGAAAVRTGGVGRFARARDRNPRALR